MRLIRLCVFVPAVLAPWAGQAQVPADPAGTITLLNGQVQAAGIDGASRVLAKGDAVYSGETVQTGPSSYALVRFTDQGSVLLRPNTGFLVEQYQYNGPAPAAAPAAAAPAQRDALPPLQTAAAAAPQSAFFRLLKGGLRAVSGLVAHADYNNYRMSTPVATMGIRGTDYDLVMCEDNCITDPTVTQSLPPGASPAGGVVSGVNDGQIVVTSFTGNSITLNPGQYAITLTDGTQYLLHGIPAFLTSQSATVATAATDAGVAAGSSAAASALAGGNLLVTVGMGGAIAAAVGVVVSTSSNNGSSATTATTSTTR
jgi:hypothetical protein